MIHPEKALLLIAGAGQYPLCTIRGARKAGIQHIAVLALKGQTRPEVLKLADEVYKTGVGEAQRAIDWIAGHAIKNVILAGQITPTALFTTRFDAKARQIINSLKIKNAHSIFGAVAKELEVSGQVRILPASTYMDEHLMPAGLLSRRPPNRRELDDIAWGEKAAAALGTVDVGQTVIVKEGMVLAAEAFEGTDAAIRRGARLGGKGAVIVKTARKGHDMRFDIPVIGMRTLRYMNRYHISALAFQAHRTIFLDQKEFLQAANRYDMAITVLDTDLPPAPTRPPQEASE